jgi:hypothetical protein
MLCLYVMFSDSFWKKYLFFIFMRKVGTCPLEKSLRMPMVNLNVKFSFTLYTRVYVEKFRTVFD